MRKPDSSKKDVAKSLHTVTVLFQVAGLMRRLGGLNENDAALDAAMRELELAGRPDPHGLRSRALGLLEAAAPAA